MTRVRSWGRWTGIIDDTDKTIILRSKRPGSGEMITTDQNESRENAIERMDLNKELADGYEILSDTE